MAIGIVIGRYSNLLFIVLLFCILTIAFFSIVKKATNIAIIFMLAATFMSLGLILMTFEIVHVQNGILQKLAKKRAVVTACGVVESAALNKNERAFFFFTVTRLRVGSNHEWKTNEKTYVQVNTTISEISVFPGAELTLIGKLAVAGRNSGYLLEHGAACSFQVERVQHINRIGSSDFLSTTLNKIRVWMSGTYRRIFSKRVSGFIEGVTLSKLNNIDNSDIANLRNCGLSHIVAVSGLHVGSAAGLALLIAAALGLKRKPRYIFAGMTGLFVLGLANFRPSATRAALMACLCFAGAMSGRSYDSLAGLCIAGFCIPGLNPKVLFDPGFQFSFAAALGIVLAVKKSRNKGKSRLFLSVCIGAQLGILPILLLKGEGVPVTAIMANLLVVPLIGPILFLSWGSSIASLISPVIGKFVSLFPELLSRYVLSVASLFSRVPGAGLFMGVISAIALIVYVLGLFETLKCLNRGRPMFRPLLAFPVAILILLVPCFSSFGFKSSNTITILDVGQGDAILIQDRSGGSVLIDGGPDEKKIMDKLRSREIRKLDLLVLSHPHDDHLSGLIEVLREIPVGSIIEPGVPTQESSKYETFLDIISTKRIPHLVAEEGQKIEISRNTSLEVLYAPRDLLNVPENLNDCSIVLIARVDGIRAALTGDIEECGQKTLLGFHPDISCDLLKVPHQGSQDAATKELIDACSPSIAAISVEKGNEYGHPSQKCLKLFRDRGVQIYRTDESGDIVININDGKMSVSKSGW